ncbi:hypothetical protein ES705_20558 [subsurface metagenome]
MREDLGVSLSSLMSAYNDARWYARKTGMMEEGRVNRAWGYIMAGKVREKQEQYRSTLTACDCRDKEIRQMWCKHNIMLQIVAKAKRKENGRG